MPDRCDVLAQRHVHPRDERVVYVDETHTYLLDGVPLPLSVSGLWGRYFPHFDADACLDKFFAAWLVDPKSKYHTMLRYLSVVHGMTETQQRDEIKKLWNMSGREASDAGTSMHRDIEFHLNGLDPPDAPNGTEFQQFLAWRRSFLPDAEPYRTEFSIFDEEAQLAGQIDCLLRTPEGKFVMVDWKRCDPRAKRPGGPPELLGPDQRAFQNEAGTGPCSELPNTKYWHYVVQQARSPQTPATRVRRLTSRQTRRSASTLTSSRRTMACASSPAGSYSCIRPSPARTVWRCRASTMSSTAS